MWTAAVGHHAACAESTRLFAQHLRQTHDSVLVTRIAGGFGNELNKVLHAFLRALLHKQKLLVVLNSLNDDGPLKYCAPSPFWSLVNESSLRNRSYDVIGNVVGDEQNWLPLSARDHALVKELMQLTHNFSALVSCASRALFQPGAAASAAMSPLVQRLTQGAQRVLGLHLRTSDIEMAERQGCLRRGSFGFFEGNGCTQAAASPKYTGRRLSLNFRQRPECSTVSDARLINAIRSGCVEEGHPCQRRRVSLYVGTDSSQALQQLQLALNRTGSNVDVVTSEGAVYHTGRHISPALQQSASLKTVVDYFMLSRVDRFLANCDVSKCFEGVPCQLWRNATDGPYPNTSNTQCGSTFAGNIFIHRFVADMRSLSAESCNAGCRKQQVGALAAGMPAVSSPPARRATRGGRASSDR